MKVEIWSDVVCPWCYIGKRRFESALREFPHGDEVEVVWKSFELDPSSEGRDTGEQSDYAGRLAGKYGTTREQAQQMLDSMTAAAAAEGLDFHFETAVAANTFLAHQLIHLAAAHGAQDAMKERLLRAYFTEGRDVGDLEVLAELAGEVGLDAVAVRTALAEESQASAVRADEAEAMSLQVSGVPFFVVDRKYGVSGAQPAEQLLAVLERAWAERSPLTVVASGEAGEVCGPEGCS